MYIHRCITHGKRHHFHLHYVTDTSYTPYMYVFKREKRITERKQFYILTTSASNLEFRVNTYISLQVVVGG